jgi:hypothetical protein
MGLMLRRIVLGLIGLAMLWLPAGAAAEGGCPNEALRTELHMGGLPGCRAYELVTPSFKDGGVPLEVLDISNDGSHVIAAIWGGFAGAEGFPAPDAATGGSVYEFSRTGSGWVPTPLSPPASRFPGAFFYAVSRDFTRTLWEVREASQPVEDADLYLREADGRFVKMGPVIDVAGLPGGSSSLVGEEYVPAFIAASADLSRVVIQPKRPKSTEPETNYYEYRVGTAERQLVGVDDEGRPIGACGAGPDAMSASGETLFFTAICGVGTANELYARLGGSETLAISEPSPVQCEECQTGHSAVTTEERPASFQGASDDGSKAFFITEQELLKGHTTANLYEFDFDRGAGHRVVLVSSGSSEAQVQHVIQVSRDGSHVYFTARGVLAGNENHSGETAEAGVENLYVYERDVAYPQGRVRFIAANTGITGAQAQATPDGRFLVFKGGSGGIFEYDAQAELLVNIITIPSEISNSHGIANGNGAPVVRSSVSDDGSSVVVRGLEGSVFEYHSAGSIADGALYLLDGGGLSPSIDASGGDVIFTAPAESLVPADDNTGEDIYDARVDGGFAEPPPEVGCEGDECQGTSLPAPSFAAPGSSSASAGGNLSPPVESKPPVVPKPGARSLTRAQKLAQALRACRKKPRRGRAGCEARARKRYGSTSHARQSDRRAK